MKCENCRASIETSYPESYEVDWYCECGIEDNGRIESTKGELGCNLHYKTVNKLCDMADKRDTEMATDEYLRSGY